jgi:hypothetical protein
MGDPGIGHQIEIVSVFGWRSACLTQFPRTDLGIKSDASLTPDGCDKASAWAVRGSYYLQNFGSSGKPEDGFRLYPTWIVVNGLTFRQVAISTHYERKHKASINDHLILELIQLLHHRRFLPSAVDESGFQYFVTDPLVLNAKPYRLVWLIPPDQSYLGVRNAFRRKHG